MVRGKPCAKPHDSSDHPRFLPAGLTPYVLYNYTTNPSPLRRHRGRRFGAQHLEVEKIGNHRYVRGRGGAIAAPYENHRKDHLKPS